MNSKVYTLQAAISKFVNDGDQLVFSGFTTNRKPYAAIHEILRQGKKDFIGLGGPAGGDWDMLIGEGRLKAYINCYTANSGFSNVCRRFRYAVEKGELLMEDYSQDAMAMMFTGAAMGVPYLPVRIMLGSDIANKWGISKEVRKTIDKLPDDKFVIQENPFNPGEKLFMLPVPQIDTAVIHVQKASPEGTCRIEGNVFHDVDLAIAARKTIITCEELVPDHVLKREPHMNKIPGFCVDAVVHAPYGAFPSQCYNYYDYDAEYLTEYENASKTDEDFKKFVDKWVYSTKTHEEYLEKVGANRLIATHAIEGIGYVAKITDVISE